MDAMLTTFIAESRENLETASRCFLDLEQRPEDAEALNELFRAMHTIKGASGLFDIPAFTSVVHAAEDVLDVVRSGELKLSSGHIDLFLDAMDQVSQWLDALESSGVLGEDSVEIGQSLTTCLRSLLNDQAVAEESTSAVADMSADSEENHVIPPFPWLKRIPETIRLEAFRCAAAKQTQVIALVYEPDEQCFFAGDDPLHTVRTLPGLAWFRVQARQGWPPAEEFDPFRCLLRFEALVLAEEAVLRHHLRYVSDQIHMAAVAPVYLVGPVGIPGEPEPFSAFLEEASLLRQQCDWQELHRRLSPLLEIGGPELWQTSVLRWLDVLLQQGTPDTTLVTALLEGLNTGTFDWPVSGSAGAPPPPVSSESVSSRLSPKQLQAIATVLQTQKRILIMSGSAECLAGRIDSVATVVRRLLVQAGMPVEELDRVQEKCRARESTEPLLAYLAKQNWPQVPDTEANGSVTLETEQPNGRVPAQAGARQTKTVLPSSEKPAIPEVTSSPVKTLKVDQQRVDALMDLVGELVVAKNALPFLARRAEDDFGMRSLAKDIKAQYAVIDRLAEELQGAVMQIRMVPISQVFQRFPRLVRDLARKLGKEVRLVVEGEEVRADKNVVESLADPLIHLIRNSLDHGLETPTEREAAGKPPEGVLVLRAVPCDDQVVLEISDDGRGIDPEVVKRKAYEKGVIDEQRLDVIDDHEALQLIFAPGFSTAEQVSDLSGRGVGMDVVRSVVSQAGGSVTVDSEKGKGTTIRLTLPLSMAVSRVMMIEVAGQCYGISMDDVAETVRVPSTAIRRIKHQGNRSRVWNR